MSTSLTTNISPGSGLLEHALDYARAGLSVLPIKAQDKVPLTSRGVRDATTNPEVIRAWWRRWPRANIAHSILPGLVVLDIDSPEAFQYLHAQGFELPATVCSATGRGEHHWYSTAGFQARNGVDIFPGVDIRAAGGYVVMPPSIHPSGIVYRWKVPFRRSAIAPCPDWLLEKLRQRDSPSVKHTTKGWAAKLREIVPEGKRNQTLAEVCGLLFRKLPAEVAAELAACWAAVKLQPPLSDVEIEQTLSSISGCELRRRGGP